MKSYIKENKELIITSLLGSIIIGLYIACCIHTHNVWGY